MTLKLCIAQLNLCVGDLDGNVEKIVAAAHAAYAAGARLLLTPELSICAYAAEDLFLRPSFILACDAAVQTLTQRLAGLKDMSVVVGHPVAVGAQHSQNSHARSRSWAVPGLLNAASVLCEGAVVATYAKRELPNYQVFDERRYFTPGQEVCVFEAGDSGQRVRVGLLICEDAWFDTPAKQAQRAGAQLLAVINASPFHVGKGYEREEAMAVRARAVGLPVAYAHLVGGQDELVFEGHSFATHSDGSLAGRAPSFQESLFFVEVNASPAGMQVRASIQPVRSPEADLWDALVLGVRDYVDKNKFPGVLLGLSGGIDSAVVLAIAVDALGPERVHALMMPSPYTAEISWLDAREMAQRLGVRYEEMSILPQFEAFKTSLAQAFRGRAQDTTEENLQARIRGMLLMALSNKFGSLVLTTGNKSELATGYCTLYGDMAGGFAVIKDVVKTRVFQLARWRNLHDPYGTGSQPIPERVISRAPSAELRPGQVDQDSLPPYEVLDAIVQGYVEGDESVEALVQQGFARSDVEKITRLLRMNEYKRRQAPVGIRVTHRSFGKDWRYPITQRYRG